MTPDDIATTYNAKPVEPVRKRDIDKALAIMRSNPEVVTAAEAVQVRNAKDFAEKIGAVHTEETAGSTFAGIRVVERENIPDNIAVFVDRHGNVLKVFKL